MTDIIIRRTADSRYELDIDGIVVESYDQTAMEHPWGWSDDAKANGATEVDIRTHNYEYIDDR